MDNSSVTLKEIVVGILAILLMLAAFAFAGTIDHEEEVRHEQWMQQREEAGEWIIR